jgi:hypothetical protein
MKIGGPKGPDPTGPISPEGTNGAKKSDAPDFSKLLDAEPTSAGGVQQLGALAEISEKLRSKEITGAQAVEMLIETVVQHRTKGASPELQQRLLAALRQFVADDPLLAQKIKELTGDDH